MTQEPHEQDPLSPEAIDSLVSDISNYLYEVDMQDQPIDELTTLNDQLYEGLVRSIDTRLAEYSQDVENRLFFDPELSVQENISQLVQEKRQLSVFYLNHAISYMVGDKDVDREHIAWATHAANRLEISLQRKTMIYALSDDLVTAVADADLDLCALTIARVGRGCVMPNREIEAITDAFYAYMEQFGISLSVVQVQEVRERAARRDVYDKYSEPSLHELSFTVTQLVAKIGDIRWFEDWPDFVGDIARYSKAAPPFGTNDELQVEGSPDTANTNRRLDYYADRIRQHTYRMGMDVVECETLMSSLFPGVWR